MAVKILVIDDEPDIESLISQYFEEQIQARELEFIYALNEEEAQEKLQNNTDIQIVLTDIYMPELDGIALLKRINEFNPLIKTIIITPYSDITNIRKAMNMGAFDFLTKPINFEDLKSTLIRAITTAWSLKTSLQEHMRYVELQKELEVAKKIQDAIIPHTFDPMPGNTSFEIFGKTLPSKAVSGDFFDFFPLTPTKLGIVIADVSEKGVPAALFMAMTRSAIRCFASQTLPVTDCLNQVNRFLCAENESSMFVTLFYGVLDTSTGDLTYCNAGHLPPFIVTADCNLSQIGKYEGISLGIVPNPHLKERNVKLNKNDTLILYTDGVTEAMNANREMYSSERLAAFLAQNCHQPLAKLVDNLVMDVNVFASYEEQSDDITILCVRYLKEINAKPKTPR